MQYWCDESNLDNIKLLFHLNEIIYKYLRVIPDETTIGFYLIKILKMTIFFFRATIDCFVLKMKLNKSKIVKNNSSKHIFQ